MINTALLAEESKERANRMSLPTARARGTDFATTGGATGSSKSTSTSTATWKPSGARPAAPVVPEFKAPEYDEGEVAKLRQRASGSQVRSLRDVTMSALAANTSDNPNVRKMTVRQALQGYGSGLGSILSAAQNAAVSQYQARYNAQYNAGQLTYNARNNMDSQTYSNLWTEFLKSGSSTTTQNSSSSNTNSNGVNAGRGVTSVPSQPRAMGPDPWSPSNIRPPVVDVRNPSTPMPYRTVAEMANDPRLA